MSTWPNWIDLIIITVSLRGSYSGFTCGFLTEILNLVGAVTVTVLSVNYASVVRDWVRPEMWPSPPLAAVVVFWGIFFSLWLSLRAIRRRLAEVIRWDRFHWFVQALGLLVGGFRGLWWAGFILLALSSSGYAALQDSIAQRSMVGPRLLTVFRTSLERLGDRFPGSEYRDSVLMPPVQPVFAVPWNFSCDAACAREAVWVRVSPVERPGIVQARERLGRLNRVS